MKTSRKVISIALSVAALNASAQLHLITGSPGPKAPTGYVSTLFRLTASGSVEKVEDLVTEPIGTDWIAASQDLRTAVLAPRARDQDLVVVSFDKAAIVKRCRKPDTGKALIEQWLWDTPDRGPVYADYLALGYQAQLRAMVLDPSIPCNQSFITISPLDAKYLASSGSAGVAGAGGQDDMQAMVEKDGTVSRFFPYGVGKAYFDYRVPPGLYSDFAHPNTFVFANNSQLFVVCMFDDGRPSSRRVLVFRKSDKTWHRIPDLIESTSYERAFGNFIASVAAVRKGGNLRESAGRREWRTEDARTGPMMGAIFLVSPFVFPGRLYLYDASTERVYTIATNQGDSEILLVEDGVVYYRASDRLYSATITASGLTPGRLLATSDIIRDAHWTFIKH